MKRETRVVGALSALPRLGSTIVAIGTFDGVHRGHTHLLAQACERAHSHGDAFVIITFTPNPHIVLRPGLQHFQLTAAPVKVELLRALKPDYIALLPFTLAVAATSADTFMDALEDRLTLREMWMGEDFAFGHKRSGNVAYLIARGQTSGFSVHVIPREGWGALPVSSTRIRQALIEGDITLANDLLGYPLRLLGEVRRTTAEGETNMLLLPIDQALPAIGTYRVQVVLAATVDCRPVEGILSIPAIVPDKDGLCELPLSLPPLSFARSGEHAVEVTVHDRMEAGESSSSATARSNRTS